MVPVGDEYRITGRPEQYLAVLRRNAAQLADRGILLKNDLPLVADKDLQRVALTNAHGPADLFRNNYSAQIINAPYNSSSFHIYSNSLSIYLLCG